MKTSKYGTLQVCVLLLGVSYARALLAPNSPGWSMRTAEWVRDIHAGWALDAVEWAWFKVHKEGRETKEPTALSDFPAPFDRRRPGLRAKTPEPAPIEVVCKQKPLAGEGEWRAIGSLVNGVPALRSTIFRPEADRPEVQVGIARFTPELTRFVLVPGTRDPGGDWSWHGGIPEDQHESLLAAFNAGFRLKDARGGFYAEGAEARRLIAGAASLVIYKDGSADILAWNGKEPAPEVAAVRQNLRLIVNRGAPVKGLAQNRGGAWGPLNHDLMLWRSGLGITRDGSLFYLAGDGLTLVGLAHALQLAGAERAMELDIHYYWPSFNIFQPTGPHDPKLKATKLLKSAKLDAARYLKPDDRDFVAAFVR